MKATISGTRNGDSWPEKGGVIELPIAEAEAMASQGLCTIGEPDVETATNGPDETR